MSKSKKGGLGFFDNLQYVASSAFNPENSDGSMSGSVLNLASMGSFGDKVNEDGNDKDMVAGFFDFLIENMPDNRSPDTILNNVLNNVAKSITDFTSEDKEMQDRWSNALNEYKKDGTHKDLAQKLAEELDKETAKEKEQGMEKTQEKTFTLTPGKDGKSEEKDSAEGQEVKSNLQNLVDGAIADFKKPAPEGLTLVKIELKMRIPGGFEAGGKSQQVKVTKTPYYVDKEGNEVVGDSEDSEITLSPGDIEDVLGEQEREKEKDQENSKDLEGHEETEKLNKDDELENAINILKSGEVPTLGQVGKTGSYANNAGIGAQKLKDAGLNLG
jgi:hypothetical protein